MAKNKKSRRGKKNQRKNTDISDVEAALEKDREDALKGGPVEQRKDEALFFVDKGPGAAAAGSPKSRRALWKSRPTKFDQILAPNPNTPSITRVKQPELKGPTVFERKRLEKAAKAYLNRSGPDGVSEIKDVWDPASVPKAANDFLEHTVSRPVKRPKITKPSIVPAVEVAAPGASYRPRYEDHQDELGAAVAQELQRQAEADRNRRRAAKIRVKSSASKPEPEADMFAEPLEVKSEPALAIKQEAAAADGPDEKTSVHQDFIDRKTRTDRNKEKRKQRAVAADRRKRARQYQRADIDRAGEIVAEIGQQEAAEAARKEYKEYQKELHAAEPKKLGKHKYIEDAKPVLLSDELPSHLRSLKVDYNPLRDRFKSLQKRNLIEVRHKARKQARRYKLVTYNKKNL